MVLKTGNDAKKKKRYKMKKLLLSLLTLIVFAALSPFIVGCSTSTPEERREKFVAALDVGVVLLEAYAVLKIEAPPDVGKAATVGLINTLETKVSEKYQTADSLEEKDKIKTVLIKLDRIATALIDAKAPD